MHEGDERIIDIGLGKGGLGNTIDLNHAAFDAGNGVLQLAIAACQQQLFIGSAKTFIRGRGISD